VGVFMAKGFGGGNPQNLQALVQQAKKMQEDIAKTQALLESYTVEAQSGGGMVKVVLDGRYRVVSLTIEKQVVDPEDVEMLQDMITAAFNEATIKVHEHAQAEMGKVTGGISIPGLF